MQAENHLILNVITVRIFIDKIVVRILFYTYYISLLLLLYCTFIYAGSAKCSIKYLINYIFLFFQSIKSKVGVCLKIEGWN